MNHKLTIKNLEVSVYLGLSQKEQSLLQKIQWTVQLTYQAHPLKSLHPTLCYDQISQTITQFSKSQKFVLLESMTQECFTLLKKEFPSIQKLKLTIHKLEPPIQNLKGGVFYEYGDFE